MIGLLRDRLIARQVSVSGFKRAGDIQYMTGTHNDVPFEVSVRDGVTILSCTHIQTYGELWYFLCHDETVESST